MDDQFTFSSRRSVVVCKNGCVASSNPLASQAGLDILKAGGNAVDAAVAVAAALNVTEPMSTGLGGDAFCLFYDSSTKTVKGLNGSGRCPEQLTLGKLAEEGFTKSHPLPPHHGHCVTVPGAAGAWVDSVEMFGSGKLSISDILKPAIEMAEEGFPVQEIAAHFWEMGSDLLQRKDNLHGQDMLIDGSAPKHGQLMFNPHLASVFRDLGKEGKAGFYSGRVAQAVVDAVREHGGLMSLGDLKAHTSTLVEPISTVYRGCRVWEIPPNGQGMTALIALNILEGFDLKAMGHNSGEYIHHIVESLRLAFADTLQYCADPESVDLPLDELLSPGYAKQRRALIKSNSTIPDSTLLRAVLEFPPGQDTVYLSTADKDGNACSFINSNFMGFGTGIVPRGCGFTLQNRGLGFSLDPTHRNVLAPGKRPYHTIIPAMVTAADTNELLLSYGVMGGFMQPQGHVQVLLNMLEFGMDPQEALDAPRVCVGQSGGDAYASPSVMNAVNVETGVPDSTIQSLKSIGHHTQTVSGHERALFGRGQVISRGSGWWRQGSANSSSAGGSLYWAGSDPRADGQVAGY